MSHILHPLVSQIHFEDPHVGVDRSTTDRSVSDRAGSNLLNQAAAAPNVSSAAPDIANAPRAEDIEDQLIAESKKKQEQELERKHTSGIPVPVPPSSSTTSAGPMSKQAEESLSGSPVSRTGINLAALSISQTAGAAGSATSAPPPLPTPSTSNAPNNHTSCGQQQHYPATETTMTRK